MNEPSVVNPEGAGKAKPGQRGTSPQESCPRCSPSRVARLPTKVPYLARPGICAAHGLLNNYRGRIKAPPQFSSGA